MEAAAIVEEERVDVEQVVVVHAACVRRGARGESNAARLVIVTIGIRSTQRLRLEEAAAPLQE